VRDASRDAAVIRRDRLFLAGLGLAVDLDDDLRGANALRDQRIANRLGAVGRKVSVVGIRAANVRVTLDDDRLLDVAVRPPRELGQRVLAGAVELRRVRGEEDLRLIGLSRLIYRAANFRKPLRAEGHLESSPHFWGDLCRERIRCASRSVQSPGR